MPFIRVWIHLIWSTKNRDKMIFENLKTKLIEHIKSNSKAKGIWLDSINCVEDHIHLLISIGAEQNISKIVMLIKGESSHWINQSGLIKTKFEWQDDYFALSVSESIVDKVRSYIKNQDEHHRIKTFTEEYQDFINKYNIKHLAQK